MSYAKNTTVSAARSEAEIKDLLRKYGADQYMSGEGGGRAIIGFSCRERKVRFELRFPAKDDERFTHVKRANRYYKEKRTEKGAAEAYEQEIRRLWRALALVIKAKLEAVDSGITTFENEFLAHIILPDGSTVGATVAPRLAEAYSSGKMPLLLPGMGETS